MTKHHRPRIHHNGRGRKLSYVLSVGLVALLTTGCAGGKAVSETDPEPTKNTTAPKDQQQLAAKAAAAIDKVYAADYQFTTSDGGRQATVRVTKGSEVLRYDMTYAADAATIAHTMTLLVNDDGTYRCITAATGSGCLLAAKDGAELSDDPRLHHVFADWLPTLASRSAALSVQTTPAQSAGLTDITGTCFSLEQLTSSVKAPVDVGVYCFDDTGTVTGIKTGAGALRLTATGPVPETIVLPAPITPTLPDIAVPPPPTPTPEPSPTP